MLNANNNVIDANLDASSETDLEAGLKAYLEANFYLNNADKADLVSGVLIFKANKSQFSKKTEYKSNKSDTA